jgi:hypothetical protein
MISSATTFFQSRRIGELSFAGCDFSGQIHQFQLGVADHLKILIVWLTPRQLPSSVPPVDRSRSQEPARSFDRAIGFGRSRQDRLKKFLSEA